LPGVLYGLKEKELNMIKLASIPTPAMVMGRELLQLILQHPEDDKPRYFYAKWCLSHGNIPRGVFIVTQLQLTELGLDDESWDAFTLRSREKKLIAEFGSGWAGQIGEYVADYHFNRGFVELVTMSARAFLEYAPALFKLAPVQHLNLTEAGDVIEELLESTYLENIRSLSLDRCHLTDRHLAELVHSHKLTQLRWLSIGENEIGLEGVKALVDASDLNLEYVRLFGNPCDPGERYAQDGDRIVERWLPEVGRYLEEEYSQRYLPWLHLKNARTIWDVVPDRFRYSSNSSEEILLNDRGKTTGA
jgi:hypothetical protein